MKLIPFLVEKPVVVVVVVVVPAVMQAALAQLRVDLPFLEPLAVL